MQDDELDAEAVWWRQCMYCGESYHVLNGNYIPQRGISACEYCTKTHGTEWTLEAFPAEAAAQGRHIA